MLTLTRTRRLGALTALAILSAAALADAQSQSVQLSQTGPPSTPAQAFPALPAAPANPADARHIVVSLKIGPENATVGTPSVARGWATTYHAGGSALRVGLYDASGTLLYETGMQDPLERREYDIASRAPHSTRQPAETTVALALPLLPDATQLVVARNDRVTQTLDVRPALRAACGQDDHRDCRAWLAHGGRPEQQPPDTTPAAPPQPPRPTPTATPAPKKHKPLTAYFDKLRHGRTVTFTAVKSAGAKSYRWTFGDGKNGKGRKTAHTYHRRGRYRVTLTVRGATGRTAKITRTVVVKR